MNIDNINNSFPSIKDLFYAQSFDDKNKTFCSFMKEIKSDMKIFNKLSLSLAEKIKQSKSNIDIFVSVPKFIDESNEIDYSKILAQTLSKELNIPYRNNAIIKIKKTKKLKTLSQEERLQEIDSAFKINLNNNLRVCIVDDVLSSGATLQEIIKTFSINNIQNVSIAILILQNY
ncbi:MAG: phosphoribosyltransferase family protein [Endomicrobiaceae bacterium]|nr:phosphoribosyltransferase family protein [Endomicrobiaceae bacterium]